MQTAIDDGDLIVRTPDLLTTTVDGELIAMSVENGMCYGFDHIGTRIWALIDEPRSLAGIVDALVTEFNVEPDICRADVSALLRELLHENMIAVHASS